MNNSVKLSSWPYLKFPLNLLSSFDFVMFKDSKQTDTSVSNLQSDIHLFEFV